MAFHTPRARSYTRPYTVPAAAQVTMPLVVAMSKAGPLNAIVPPMKFLSAGSYV